LCCRGDKVEEEFPLIGFSGPEHIVLKALPGFLL